MPHDKLIMFDGSLIADCECGSIAFMRIENGSAEKIKKELMRIISKHLDCHKHRIFIFGSRVSGKGDDRSDIDLGIEGPQQIPMITLSKIREEIEALPILYRVDVVDFSSVSDQFKRVALQHIELITPK